MEFGAFDDQQKEFVIFRPDTPLPWINYLGVDEFFGLISNTAGGYCFFKDARLRRLTRYRYNNIPMDSNGRYLYIKDGETVWNPMWKPMRTPLDAYECRHGLGYTKITGRKNDLEAEITFFVPPGSHHEIWLVKLRNHSANMKNVRLWSFIEWCLWDAYDDMTNFQRNYSIGQVEVYENTVYHISEYRERRNHYAYFASTLPVSGFDTSRDAFVGLHYGLESPRAIREGTCTNSIAQGWVPIGVHQLDLRLGARTEQAFSFILGYAENDPENKYNQDGSIQKEKIIQTVSEYTGSEKAEKELAQLKTYWSELLNTYQVNSGDTVVNRMVNIWNQYQCMVTFNLSRSASLYESGIGRGMGFRDSTQDILGFVHMIPERARERLMDLAATQLSDGACYHQYQPLTKKGNTEIGGGFNDDPLWLVIAVSAYIKETGDHSILQAPVGFADKESEDTTMLDHLFSSIQYIFSNRGPHDLPLIGHADWNDCLNLNCFSKNPDESFQLAGHIENDAVAESLLIAGMFCSACEELASLLEYSGRNQEATDYRNYAMQMREAVYEHGWDGAWFLRAYDAFGRKVGSAENEEGKIFIESQGWCIMAGLGIENGYAQIALDSVAKHLATPDGIVLQQPPYALYREHMGEISSYPPGYKENAGIFTHNNTWIQIAETKIGRGNRAMAYYKSICPVTKLQNSEIYRSEPYVYSQMTAGPDAATPGEGKNSWLTGTAAWSFVAVSQHILGIKPELEGLRIDPCIPSDWTEFRVRRYFRNAFYNISIQNPDKVTAGVRQIKVDGKEIEGTLIPVFSDGREHQVRVIMGHD